MGDVVNTGLLLTNLLLLFVSAVMAYGAAQRNREAKLQLVKIYEYIKQRQTQRNMRKRR